MDLLPKGSSSNSFLFPFNIPAHLLLHATNPYLEWMDELNSSDIIICRNSNGNFNVACYGRFLFYFWYCLHDVAEFSQIRNYTRRLTYVLPSTTKSFSLAKLLMLWLRATRMSVLIWYMTAEWIWEKNKLHVVPETRIDIGLFFK